MIVGELVSFLKMDTADFERGMALGESRLASLGSKMTTFGGIAVGTGVIAGAAAVHFVSMAGDFESSTNRLVTSAGESHTGLELVRTGILALAGDVGYSAEELSTAMYKIESGGQHGADGLIVLKAAAQGAKAENADLAVVSDALTSVLQDYHRGASDSAEITSKLVAATGAGKMTFEQLAGSLNSILPVASANHISLNEILGDLASMTVHGISAQQASQNLANAVRNMSAPNNVAAKELAMLGLSATELSSHLGERGLSGTMQIVSQAILKGMGPGSTQVVVDLNNALKGMPPEVQKLGQAYLTGEVSRSEFAKGITQLDGIAGSQARQFAVLVNQTHGLGKETKSASEIYQSYTQALGKATGGATGLNVALMLTGENTDITKKAIDAVSGATTEAGGNVKGWSDIQGTFNQKMAEAKDGLNATGITIGTYLLPVASKIAGVFADASHYLSDHKGIAETVAYTLGTVVVAAITLLTIATVKWAVTSAISLAEDTVKGAVWLVTKLLQLDGVAAGMLMLTLAGGTWLASSVLNMVKDAAQGVLWVATKVGQFVVVSAAAIVSGAATAAAWIAANAAMILATGGIVLAIGAVILIAYEVVKHWQGIKDFFGGLWQAVKDKFWEFVGWISGFGGWVLNAIGDVGHLLYDAGAKIVGGLISGIKNEIGGVGNAIGGVVGKIRDFLPFSPAKEGPLSGLGSPELAGQKISDMLAVGMESEISRVKQAAYNVTSNINLAAPTSAPASSSAPTVQIDNFHAHNATTAEDLATEIDWMVRSSGR